MLEYIILGFLMGCAASGYDLKQYICLLYTSTNDNRKGGQHENKGTCP